MLKRLRNHLNEPVDIASLAVFRVLFGGLMCVAAVRFIAEGWVERVYLRPSFFFKYWGFEWVQVLPAPGMTILFVVMAVSALLVMVGYRYRFAAITFFVTFVYADLCDVTNYLNHHYQAALLALLCCALPLHGAWSLDARRNPALARSRVPRVLLYLVRFQVGVVYVFAGLAKAQPDWLLHAQPLGIWLAARTEIPVLGPLFAQPWAPMLFSWGGFLFDTTIVGWLLWRRSRPLAYVAVIVFHTLTAILFNIGIFPALMILSAPIFFAPDWPRRVLRRVSRRRATGDQAFDVQEPTAPSLGPVALTAVALVVFVELALPLRAFAYGGEVLWHEQGMRYSWRVMVRSKTGAVRYRVRATGLPREQYVEPCRYLNSLQEREMAGQPDLILQLAHHIAADYRARGYDDVQVRADALVSLNGRPAARLIDPAVDLAATEDDLAPADYILPAPSGRPLHARRDP